MDNKERRKIGFYFMLFLFSAGLIIACIIYYKDCRDLILVNKEKVVTDGMITNLYRDNYGEYPTYRYEFTFKDEKGDAKNYIYRSNLDNEYFKKRQIYRVAYQRSNPMNFFLEDMNPMRETLTVISSLIGILLLMIVFYKKLVRNV